MAIRADGLAKTFLIPHERRSTLREHALHPFRRTSYEEQEALVDVSFEVHSGEFFGVVGQNGSGKSTLLKLLARIYRPDRGSVTLNGQVSPFIELGVGFNPELSGRDNVRINATLLGLSAEELDSRFDEIIAFAELERFVDQKLKNYSSGMQLRLAYAIAIQVPFDILLLDEVLTVGDQNFQDKCFATFEAMRVAGKTIVLVTHSLPMVTRFCDRALLLRDGRIQAIGQPQEVIDAYLEQERKRAVQAAGAQRSLSPSRVGFAEAGTAVGERRSSAPSREEIALMAPQQVYDIVRTQQARLAHREQKLLGVPALEREAAELRREVDQLTRVVETLGRRHYGDPPVPPEALRARMSTRSSVINFLAQGLETAEKAIAAFGDAPTEPVLEWGCGSGRALRWLRCYPGWRERYHGCDPDPEAVAWASECLGLELKVCADEPPLPYPDEAFGGVFGLGMLTRIHPERHRGWYVDLRRILRPGACVLLTTQGSARIPANANALARAFETEGWAYLAEGGAVPAAFVNEAYTRRMVEGLLMIEEYRERASGLADTYLLRRP